MKKGKGNERPHLFRRLHVLIGVLEHPEHPATGQCLCVTCNSWQGFSFCCIQDAAPVRRMSCPGVESLSWNPIYKMPPSRELSLSLLETNAGAETACCYCM
jgi:hypothetical protein